MTYVEEISREPVAGVVGVILIVEVVYWLVTIAYTVWKWINGRKVAVREYRREWRSRRRRRCERVVPEHDHVRYGEER